MAHISVKPPTRYYTLFKEFQEIIEDQLIELIKI